MAAPQFQEFLTVPLQILDQRGLWEVFQRVLRMSDADCWDVSLREELLDLSAEEITPPRNHFLYKAHYWPFGDLTSDAAPAALLGLAGEELDAEHRGFLLRLSFSVYRLFEQLLTDLGKQSAVIMEQVSGSRLLIDAEVPELHCYRGFLSQLCTREESLQ